jgi:hypothetical protein
MKVSVRGPIITLQGKAALLRQLDHEIGYLFQLDCIEDMPTLRAVCSVLPATFAEYKDTPPTSGLLHLSGRGLAIRGRKKMLRRLLCELNTLIGRQVVTATSTPILWTLRDYLVLCYGKEKV